MTAGNAPTDRTTTMHTLRTVATLAFTAVALTIAGYVFWLQDLRYSLPTPRPTGLRQVEPGSTVPWPTALERVVAAEAQAPVLLHFFNPDCPCSRFNRDHVRALQRQFAGRVRFVTVAESTGPAEPVGDEELVPDPEGAIAAAFGVYSTPQAVLLDRERRLVFRGNFNSTRYCTTPQTQFARLAIEALLAATPRPSDPRADVAYGCPLPGEECRDVR